MKCRYCRKEIKDGQIIHAYIIKEFNEHELLDINKMNIAHNECQYNFWKSIA